MSCIIFVGQNTNVQNNLCNTCLLRDSRDPTVYLDCKPVMYIPSAYLPPFQWPFSRLTCVSQFILRFWATVCKTVRSMLSDHCPDCLLVCNIGILWPNGWMDQDETWRGSRPRPWSHCGRWGPSCPPPKGHSPQFLAHVCCGQTAGWIKMPLGTEVGLGPGDIVGTELLPQKGGHSSPHFRPCIVARCLDGSRCHLVWR